MEILGINKESSQGEVIAQAPCRNTIKICLQKVGAKKGVSLVPKGSARPQDTRRQMAGVSARNCMPQVCTLIISNFVKGKHEIPKRLTEDCRIAHKVAEQLAQLQMNNVQSFQVCNHDTTSTHVHNIVRSGDSNHDNWLLVSTTSKEKAHEKDHQLSLAKKILSATACQQSGT